MDKAILKAKREIDKKMNRLSDMDKPRDKKLKKCAKVMKKAKK